MKLETIIETCAEPIVVYDKNGLATYVNSGFERVFGWQRRELLGKRIDFVPEDQASLTGQAVARVLAGQTVSGMETRRTTKHGQMIHVRLSAAPLKDETDTFDGMVVTLQDISDLVASRQEAQAANRAKGQFLSNISHEVRTPMNHIMGMLDLLLATRLDEEQQEFLEILQKSATSLMAVVNDMLDYSRIQAGKVDCDHIGFDLRTLAETITAPMGLKSAEKGLRFSLIVHQLVPSLLVGDPGHLRQVLVNLCSNAVKFTEKGGIKVNIFLEREDDQTADILFEVIDTGIGIAADQIQSIFDSFVQADGSATRKYGGSGLGLSISNRLVQLMGSAIEVKSLPGKGSTFFFTLSFDKQAVGVKKKIAVPVSFQGKKILLVDENPMDRRVFKTLSKDWDCLFDEADTPEAALEKLKGATDKNPPFDIIVLNMDLPGMGGELLAKTIMGFPWAMDILIIMLASLGKPGDVVRLRKLGLNGYLSKPIKPSELYDCIATAMAVKYRGQKQMITRHLLQENKKQQVKILLVESGRAIRKSILNILNKSGYSATSKTDLGSAFKAFQTGAYNLVLLDIDLSSSMDMVQTMRQYEKQEKMGWVPIIAMAENPGENQAKGLHRVSMDACLSKPILPADLIKAIETWTWQNEGFLRAHVGGYSRIKSKKNQGIVFNLKVALERAMDDKKFLEMLVNEFVATLPEKIEAIRKAVFKKDTEAVITAAQSLKGSSGNMGADTIKEAAQAIETMGEAGDLGLAGNRITQLENESGRFKEYVNTIKWSEV
ncbi:MAG: response regulator [Proteobacteria bacterium]|nr:response regulator [Desulfobacula sp.]MBU4129329.1 response regulator [Pseudomonadota bacterium]